jgi:phage terminase small subunit
MKLQPKHKSFADSYLETGNASESARRAGYSAPSAGVTGSKLLRRLDVQQYLADKAAKLQSATDVTQDKVIEELSALAFANIADFITVDADGHPTVDFSTATPEQLRAITSVATKSRALYDKEGRVVGKEKQSRFTMADKYKGLELLGKHIGMFKEPETRVVIDIADRLLMARQRVASLGADASSVSD